MDSEIKLPNKMSELIRVALDDLAKVEAMPGEYIVDMNKWHLAARDGRTKCHVCMAGAVMSMSLGTARQEASWPSKYSPHNARCLAAIDSLRVGKVLLAILDLGITFDITKRIGLKYGRAIMDYKESPVGFRQDMERLAIDLEAAGL